VSTLTPDTPPPAEPPRRAGFADTRWSVVLRAGRNDTPRARAALADLCRNYWFPLYAHVRRRGHSAHDAQDLTQAFFARLLEHDTLAGADPQRGRFRSFLLASLNHFLADAWDRTRAQKRGGDREIVPLDLDRAEERFATHPAVGLSPDQAFDRQWALALLETVLGRLEAEWTREGKAGSFAALKQTLTGARGEQPYATLAAELGQTEGAVKVAVHRLRRRYRELLQAEIADTVASHDEEKDEMTTLLRALAGG
jgi:RNA polymerase sigma factor (sigma-70 family)